MNGKGQHMDALEILLSEKHCRELVLAAAEAVDRQDYEGLVAFFTEDATLVRLGGQALQGRSAILASYASKNPDRLTQHLVCNHRVEVDPCGFAQSRCKVLLYTSDRHRELTHQGRLADAMHQVGEMVDRLVLTSDGWRIQQREAWFDLRVNAMA